MTHPSGDRYSGAGHDRDSREPKRRWGKVAAIVVAVVILLMLVVNLIGGGDGGHGPGRHGLLEQPAQTTLIRS